MSSSSRRKPSVILMMLIGLPGSGKTRLAKYLKQTLPKMSRTEMQAKYEVIHVCYDEIVPVEKQLEIITSGSESNWKQSRKSITSDVEGLVKALLGHETSPSGNAENRIEHLATDVGAADDVIVLVDDNMYYRSMRYEYFRLARQYSLGFCQACIDCPKSSAKKNNEDRTQRIPEAVIDVMASRLEVPDPSKNSWERFSLLIPYTQNDASADAIVDVVEAAAKEPFTPSEDDSEERESSRVACRASIVHQCDKMLRKFVGNRMKEIKRREGKIEMSSVFSVLNETRHKLLHDIKRGKVTLNPEIILNLGELQEENVEPLSRFIEELYTNRLQEIHKL